MQDNVIDGRYKVLGKIGKGSFARVYQGIDIVTQKKVAVKVESLDYSQNFERSLDIFSLANQAEIQGIPRLLWSGNTSQHNILIMDYCGKDLTEFKDENSAYFSESQIAKLAQSLLFSLEGLHSLGYIHRDIKPDNISRNATGQYFLYDYGLSGAFIDHEYWDHYDFSDNASFVGTMRYASRHALNCYTQSRRDDLESLGYVMIYLFSGRLPWQGLDISNKKRKMKEICRIKSSMSIQVLCLDCPNSLYQYMQYCKNLGFYEKPEYSFLRSLFAPQIRSEDVRGESKENQHINIEESN